VAGRSTAAKLKLSERGLRALDAAGKAGTCARRRRVRG
jgi:hypothetical protein